MELVDPLRAAIAIFSGQYGVAADRQIRAAGLSWERRRGGFNG